MSNFIERYVYDVTRRLPEKERDEISKELTANIYDMLPDDADENEIKSVLYKLGAPAFLAGKYRKNPQYLISPGIYDDYVRLLKWMLPLAGVIGMVIGIITGSTDAIKDSMINISKVLSKGISAGLSAAFQALAWTTIGFVIAERTGDKSQESTSWKVEDLPEILPKSKYPISLSDSIAELVLTVVFMVVAILVCSGAVPIAFMIRHGNTQIRTLFSPGFLESCIPPIIIMALFGVGECIIKIKDRRWSIPVCCTVVLSNIVSVSALIYLVSRPDILSEEFKGFMKSTVWVSSGPFLWGINPAMIFLLIVIVCSFAECGNAIYKTLKSQKV
ncbi:hypothetical protein [Lacrimispora brassicae]